MSIESTPVGSLAMRFMELLGETYDEDATVRTVAIVAEVDTPDSSEVLVVCDDDRRWVQLAFLEWAVETLDVMAVHVDRGDDD